MTNYQLITMNYYKDGSIILWGRADYDTKKKFIVKNFMPYFYASTQEKIVPDRRIVEVQKDGFKSLFGKSYNKIIVKTPLDVPVLREYYKDTCEDDVKFVLRFLIDKKIKNGFTVNGYVSKRGIVDHTAIEPVEFRVEPLTTIIDIEVYNPEKRFPNHENPIHKIIAVTVFDEKYKKYITYFLDEYREKTRKTDDWLLIILDVEKDLIRKTIKYLEYIEFDLISGWNVDFDVDYFFARADYLGIEYNLEGYMNFDLLTFYKKIKYRSLGNRLKDVVIEEKLVESEEDLAASEFSNELYEIKANRPRLITYNFDDVRFCYEIKLKYLIDLYFWDIKNESGLSDIDSTKFNSYIIDRIALEVSDELLPSKRTRKKKGKKYKAAINFPPKPGIYDNVASFDFTRHFPSTIIMFNYSVEYAGLTLKERLKKPLGLMGRICLILITNRNKQDKLLDEYLREFGPESPEYKSQKIRRDSAKFLLNAAYGVFGSVHFRLYNYRVVEAMVKTAMDGLRYMKKVVEDYGYKVIQGHTDNVMVQIDRDKVDVLLIHINRKFKEYAISKGVEPLWEVKFEMYASKVIFAPAKKDESVGAVTRYAANVIEKDYVPVEPYLFVKGFEIVRGDQSPLTKDIQRKLFKAIFDEKIDQYIKELRGIIKTIKKGKYDIDHLSTRTNIGKDLKEYVNKNVLYKSMINAKNLLGLDIKKGDRIKIIYLGKSHGLKYNQPLAYFEKKTLIQNKIDINYDTIVDKNIRVKISSLLQVAGHEWSNLEGVSQKKLSGLL